VGTSVRTPADGPPLVTESGLMAPVLEMEFTANFPRMGGRRAAEAAAMAVIGVIEAPKWFLAPVIEAGRSVGTCLLARTTADTCRIVLTADDTGLTVAATDDATIMFDSAEHSGARHLPLLTVVDGLSVHHGPDGHMWVVWQGAWRSA